MGAVLLGQPFPGPLLAVDYDRFSSLQTGRVTGTIVQAGVVLPRINFEYFRFIEQQSGCTSTRFAPPGCSTSRGGFMGRVGWFKPFHVL